MNKLLKYIIVLLFVVCAGYRSYGQYYYRPVPRRYSPGPPPGYGPGMVVHQSNSGDKVLNVKEHYIRRQLNLPPEQAKKFFPLYHEYQMELFNMLRLKRLNNSRTQPDGTEQVDKDLYYETQIVNIKQRFKDAFLRILPPEKVSELYKSEKEFNDELVRSLSERNNMPPN